MGKSEVYSWRVSQELKMALESEARRAKGSVADVLELAARAWLEKHRKRESSAAAEEARIRARASRCLGSIESGDPSRSENVSRTIRQRLSARRAG